MANTNLDQLLADHPASGYSADDIFLIRKDGQDKALTGTQLAAGIQATLTTVTEVDPGDGIDVDSSTPQSPVVSLAPFMRINDYSAGSYAKNQVVKSGGVIYISNVDGNGDAPPSSNWTAITNFGDLIETILNLFG